MKKKTTTQNLEAKFDQGADVLDFFEATKARWGGARAGAGRKSSGRIQYITRLSPSLIRAIKGRAKREHRKECEVVESLLAPALK
jgi:hypothetical protein